MTGANLLWREAGVARLVVDHERMARAGVRCEKVDGALDVVSEARLHPAEERHLGTDEAMAEHFSSKIGVAPTHERRLELRAHPRREVPVLLHGADVSLRGKAPALDHGLRELVEGGAEARRLVAVLRGGCPLLLRITLGACG